MPVCSPIPYPFSAVLPAELVPACVCTLAASLDIAAGIPSKSVRSGDPQCSRSEISLKVAGVAVLQPLADLLELFVSVEVLVVL